MVKGEKTSARGSRGKIEKIRRNPYKGLKQWGEHGGKGV